MSAESEIVHVALGERRYDIVLGRDILPRAGALIETWLKKPNARVSRSAVVIFDENTRTHAATIRQSLADSGWSLRETGVPPGETSKSLASASRLYDALVDANADRGTCVIAVGGGVIGDLAGFAASTFNRGLPFIQIPTTLLADVDSSVGGKVGINHPKAKNLIGAFHQPLGVLIDTACLSTLPSREYNSGLAEIIKYGVILDADFFVWLEKNLEAVLRQEAEAVRYAVSRSCRLKADVVEQDEFERSGLRAALNYGHTFAHAFEALAGYGELLHGEAVAIGMVCASRLAEKLGRISSDSTSRQIELLRRAQLPTDVPETILRRESEILACMRLDKKSVGGKLRFVLPTRIGHVEVVDGVPELDVLNALR